MIIFRLRVGIGVALGLTIAAILGWVATGHRMPPWAHDWPTTTGGVIAWVAADVVALSLTLFVLFGGGHR